MTRRTLTSTFIAIGLLAGSTVGVAAQDAEAGYAVPVEVSGSSSMPSGCSMASVPADEATPDQERRRFTCIGSIPGSWSMSDPRLEGTVLRISEASVHSGPGLETLEAACAEDAECEAPFVDTQLRAFSIENAEGAWRERPRLVVSFPGSDPVLPFPLRG